MSGAGRLEGRVCIVTGASGGIGAATVELYQREGAKVVGVDLLDGAPGDLALQVDVTSEDDVAGAFARVREEFGHIDVLFNNAGISPNDDGSVIETTLEAWERVQNVNLRSVFLCCKHGIPHLLENDGPLRGSVINTASFVAVMGAATSQISYTASKGGVLALSRELGVEFARRGVRVNALCPGPVDTPLLKELFAKDPEKAARRLVHVPMGRFARAEEIAQGALFLASDESSFVTARPSLSTAASAAPTRHRWTRCSARSTTSVISPPTSTGPSRSSRRPSACRLRAPSSCRSSRYPGLPRFRDGLRRGVHDHGPRAARAAPRRPADPAGSRGPRSR